ncbi:hypothetical protein ABTK17_19810, partial [Acinetobacter baumannii]
LLRSFQPGLLDEVLEPIRVRIQEILTFLGLPADSEDRVRLLTMGARPAGPFFNTVAMATMQRKRLFVRYDPRSKEGATDREVSPQR